MRRMKPQKQLLQFVMLALLSVVSVLVTSNESYAALDCGACHGAGTADMRPLDDATRNPNTGAFVGNHQKHLGAAAIPASQGMSACTACHSNASHTLDANYNSAHRDGSIQLSTGVGYTKGVFFNQTSVPQLSKCSTASCHNPYTDGTPKLTPAWGGTGDCSTCHDTPPTTNAHEVHDLAGFGDCTACHGLGNDGQPGHSQDGIKLDNAAVGYRASTPKHSSAAADFTSTCTKSCHDTGRSAVASPVWSATGQPACTACHALKPATGSHTKHLVNTTSATFACDKCHTGAVEGSDAGTAHLDGNIDTLPALGYPQSKAKGSTLATCSTVYCHSNVQGTGGSGAPTSYATVTWGATGTAFCGTCHDAAPATGSHAKHFTGIQSLGTGLAACANCHTAYGTPTHSDGLINILSASTYSQTGTPGNGYGTCSTASCHDAGRGSAVTPVWGAPSIPACTSCHALIPATGSHVKHVSTTLNAKVACSQCHTGTTQGGPAGAGHLDGNIDTAAALGYPQDKGKNIAFASCTTTYCHSNVQPDDGVGAYTSKSVAWGSAALDCSSCHDAQPTTGSHSVHIAKDATCTNCHTAADTATHVNALVNVGGAKVTTAQYSGTPAPGNAYGSCSTSTCHSGNGLFTPAAAAWGGDLNCAGCHSFPPPTAYHAGITNNCNSCHSDASAGDVNTSTITNPAMHMNNVVDGGQCDACHGYPPVKSLTNAYGTAGTPGNYTGAKLATNLTAGGVHDVKGHLLITVKPSDGFSPCLTCHPQGVTHNTGFSNVSTTKVQVVVDSQFKFNKDQAIVYSAYQRASTAATGTCSNVSCHFKVTPTW